MTDKFLLVSFLGVIFISALPLACGQSSNATTPQNKILSVSTQSLTVLPCVSVTNQSSSINWTFTPVASNSPQQVVSQCNVTSPGYGVQSVSDGGCSLVINQTDFTSGGQSGGQSGVPTACAGTYTCVDVNVTSSAQVIATDCRSSTNATQQPLPSNSYVSLTCKCSYTGAGYLEASMLWAYNQTLYAGFNPITNGLSTYIKSVLTVQVSAADLQGFLCLLQFSLPPNSTVPPQEAGNFVSRVVQYFPPFNTTQTAEESTGTPATQISTLGSVGGHNGGQTAKVPEVEEAAKQPSSEAPGEREEVTERGHPQVNEIVKFPISDQTTDATVHIFKSTNEDELWNTESGFEQSTPPSDENSEGTTSNVVLPSIILAAAQPPPHPGPGAPSKGGARPRGGRKGGLPPHIRPHRGGKGAGAGLNCAECSDAVCNNAGQLVVRDHLFYCNCSDDYIGFRCELPANSTWNALRHLLNGTDQQVPEDTLSQCDDCGERLCQHGGKFVVLPHIAFCNCTKKKKVPTATLR